MGVQRLQLLRCHKRQARVDLSAQRGALAEAQESSASMPCHQDGVINARPVISAQTGIDCVQVVPDEIYQGQPPRRSWWEYRTFHNDIPWAFGRIGRLVGCNTKARKIVDRIKVCSFRAVIQLEILFQNLTDLSLAQIHDDASVI